MKKIATAMTTVAVAGVTVLAAQPAHATSYYYSSCTALHKVYRYGVAKSYSAASSQKSHGFYAPSASTTARKVYAANYTRLDRDKDGTACEVQR